MKNFLLKIVFFLIPFVISLVGIVYMDFFKVFLNYDEYYNKDLFISLNREFVCLKSLEKIPLNKKPDSFIFGSSRSQAFKCKDWTKHLKNYNELFHFDAANEALVGVLNKLEYLEKNNYKIENVLLVLDRGLLTQTNFNNRKSSLTISYPSISENTIYGFYKPFIMSSFNPKFILSYFDFYLFRKHRSYMGQYIANSKYPNTVNSINMDIFYGKEKEIKEDSLAYYEKTINSGIFYERTNLPEDTDILNLEVIEILKKIKMILDKNNSNYRIVLSPMYNQIKFNKENLHTIKSIFKAESVYDFSGKNTFTNKLGSFYEKSHYRPHIAREIMNQMY